MSTSSSQRRVRHRTTRRSLARQLLLWLVYLSATSYAICIGALLSLRYVDPVSTALQMQRRVEAALANRPYEKKEQWKPLEQIAESLRHAVVAAEDSRFYQHDGIDWKELHDAIEADRERGRFWRGGSTITQQLVKNLFLTTHGSFLRKAVEMSLAPVADLILSKRRILEIYLNVVEWGPGVYGAEAAAQYHYGIPASRLSRDQAARLAACLPAPRHRQPRHMDHYSSIILERMSRMGW